MLLIAEGVPLFVELKAVEKTPKNIAFDFSKQPTLIQKESLRRAHSAGAYAYCWVYYKEQGIVQTVPYGLTYNERVFEDNCKRAPRYSIDNPHQWLVYGDILREPKAPLNEFWGLHDVSQFLNNIEDWLKTEAMSRGPVSVKP